MDPYFGRRYGGGMMCGVMCPPDTFLYSYYCCNYGECCIHLGGWAIFFIIVAVALFLLCCAGCIGGCLYAARKSSSSNSEP